MLPAFMYKLYTRLLEGRYCIKGKFVVCIYSYCGAGHDHVAEGFVGSNEVFGNGVGNGDKVGFEIFRVLDYEGGIHD